MIKRFRDGAAGLFEHPCERFTDSLRTRLALRWMCAGMKLAAASAWPASTARTIFQVLGDCCADPILARES